MKLTRTAPIALAMLLVGLCAAPSVEARQAEIHPRVGQELDQSERDYFNLFRQWPEGTVVTSRPADDVVRFEHADESNYSLTVSNQAFESLGMYIDLFEDSEAVRRSVNFSHLGDIAGFRDRYRERAAPTIAALSGRQATLTLLHADSDHLIVLEGNAPYQWRQVDERVRVVRPESIGFITQPRALWAKAPRTAIGLVAAALPIVLVNPDISAGDGLGLLGTAGSAYLGYSWGTAPTLHYVDGNPARFESVGASLMSKGAFADGLLPPELTIPFGGRAAFGDGSSSRGSFVPVTRLTISSALLLSLSEREGFAATGFGLTDFEPRNLPWLRVGLEKDRSHALSYGAEAMIALSTAPEEPTLAYSGQLLTVFADWHPLRRALVHYDRRWSVTIGAGLTAGRIASSTDIEWSRQILNLAPELSEESSIGQNAWTGAAQLRAAALWRFDSSKLARVQLHAWVPPISLGEEDLTVGSNTIYGFDKVAIPIGVSFGVVHELGR